MDRADVVGGLRRWETFTQHTIEHVGQYRCMGIACMGDVLNNESIMVLGASILEPFDSLCHHHSYKEGGCMGTGLWRMRKGRLIWDVIESSGEGVPNIGRSNGCRDAALVESLPRFLAIRP